jgi:hypothetical protein
MCVAWRLAQDRAVSEAQILEFSTSSHRLIASKGPLPDIAAANLHGEYQQQSRTRPTLRQSWIRNLHPRSWCIGRRRISSA